MADPIPTPNAFTPEMQAQFNDLMALSTGRAQRQEPIHQAAMAMATRMAPSYARDAMSPVRTASTPGAAGAGAGTGAAGADGGPNAKMLASFLAAMLPALAGAGGNLGGLLDLLKKLFGHNGMTYPLSENTTGQPFIGPKHSTYQGGTPGNPQDIDPYGIPGYQPAPDPMPTVTTDEFFNAPWPETSTPFAPFDPGMLPGGNPTGRPDDPFHWPKP